jgi:hypothetical protein
LKHLPPSYHSKSLHERLLDTAFLISWCKLTLDIRKDDPHENSFRLVGARIRSPETARFESSLGQTYLGCAAQWLGRTTNRAPDQEHRARTNHWLAFATDLARDRASLSAVFKGLTPLHTILFFWKRHYVYDNSLVPPLLTRWLDALLAGGRALKQLSSDENKIIQEQGRSFNYNFDLLIHSIALGDRPDDWTINLSTLTEIETFELDEPPGAWPESPPTIPNVITWRPSPVETREGNWVLKSSRTLVSQSISMTPATMWTGECLYLVEQPQDDHSPIALRGPSRRHPALKRRSASQPPALRRREAAYCTNSISRYDHLPFSEASGYNRYWLTACHICPMDSRLRFDCFVDRTSCESFYNVYYYPTMSLRHCMRGESRPETCQETDEWRTWSFMGTATDA